MLVNDTYTNNKHVIAICAQHIRAQLDLFGDSVREYDRSDGNLDVLVMFDAGVRDIVALYQKLKSLLGRCVCLLAQASVERSSNQYFRRFATRETEPVYGRDFAFH